MANENLFTVSDYKGLEADAVVLFVPHSKENLAADLYVGASRAKLAVYLVTNKSVDLPGL
ncbi:MAG: ATP-binding domain-containing protein [Chloroflexi bacterium]|nr:ATP-binding domain-containing protein [Chloroflexota bacterium]